MAARVAAGARRAARAVARHRVEDERGGTGALRCGRAGASPRAATASLDAALDRGGLTLRGYDRVLRIGWTLADLEGGARPDADHLGRALLMRQHAEAAA